MRQLHKTEIAFVSFLDPLQFSFDPVGAFASLDDDGRFARMRGLQVCHRQSPAHAAFRQQPVIIFKALEMILVPVVFLRRPVDVDGVCQTDR